MLILIAESKTMSGSEHEVSPETLKEHLPAGIQTADTIMHRLRPLSAADIVAETGLSPSLAAAMKSMAYEFPNTAMGYEAIRAYTGVVFKALNYDTLSDDARARCESDVRIISSLYGVLRPDDIIKPYRLDFTSKAAPGEKAMHTFLKKDVTIQIVRTLKAKNDTELLNLLPADASKCVDWKIVRKFCKVNKVDFLEVTDGGVTKTPNATKLKTLRGQLLRHILSANVSDLKTLAAASTDFFTPVTSVNISGVTPIYPDRILFLS